MYHGTVSGRTYNLKVYVLGAKQEGAYSDAIKINFTGLPTDGTADVILYDSKNNEVGYISSVDCSTGSATVTFINGTNATLAASNNYKAMIRVSSPSSLTGSRAQTTMALTTGSVPMPSVTSLTLSPDTLNLEVGDTSALTATVGPDTANPTVVWTSSDPSVATVDENGVVTAVGPGTVTITCTATNGTPDDTSDDKSAICTVTVTLPVQYIAGYSLSLKGDIAMNFYFDLHEVDPAGATVDFTWDTNKSQHSSFAGLSTVTVDQNQYYRISVPVNAKEINDEISLTLKNGDTVLQTHRFSVADYARRVYANEGNEFGSYAALTELQKLCLQMLIYGAKAQLQFSYNTTALADAGLTYTLDAVDASTLPDTTVKDLSAFGLEYFGSSLLLESTLTHRLYFRVENADLLAAAAVSYGTKKLDFTAVTDKTPLGNPEGDYVYVDLADISAKRITSPFTVTFTNGTSTVRMNVNAASYIKRALTTGDETLKNTVTALYWYNQAAVAYFAAKNG